MALKTRSREAAQTRIVELLQKKSPRPILIGEAALEVGGLWRIEEVEALIEDMVTEGILEKTGPQGNNHSDGYILRGV